MAGAQRHAGKSGARRGTSAGAALTNRERTRAGRAGGATAPAAARRGRGWTLIFGLGAAVLVVGAAIAVGVVTRGGGSETPAAATSLAPVQGRVRGSPTAPVTIIEYGDLQCPNCAAFTRSTEPELVRRYIDTGKVKMEVRQFAFLGKESVRAAEANECAGEQSKFWEYRAALYAAQNGENRGAFSDNNLKAIAQRNGLDGDALAACLDSGRYSERVQADVLEGRTRGVRATPTFLINGHMVEGALPLASFQAVIEQALAEVGAGR